MQVNQEFKPKIVAFAVTGAPMQVQTWQEPTVPAIRQMSRSFVYLAPAV